MNKWYELADRLLTKRGTDSVMTRLPAGHDVATAGRPAGTSVTHTLKAFVYSDAQQLRALTTDITGRSLCIVAANHIGPLGEPKPQDRVDQTGKRYVVEAVEPMPQISGEGVPAWTLILRAQGPTP